jgi:twitching motility protein PilU
MPAVEILLNTRHISELIDRGEINSVKEAMERSMAPGSQTFEQDLFRLYREDDHARRSAVEFRLRRPTCRGSSTTRSSASMRRRRPDEAALAAARPRNHRPGAGGASFAEFSLNLDEGKS